MGTNNQYSIPNFMEECTEYYISPFTIFSNTMFLIVFLIYPLYLLISLMDDTVSNGLIASEIILTLFVIAGITFLIIQVIIPLIKLLCIIIKGERIKAEVVSYIYDDIYINGDIKLCLILRINQNEQIKYLKCYTYNSEEVFTQGYYITLLKYKNMYKIKRAINNEELFTDY